ncbi:MAG: hypothetical protein WCP98_20125, partial [Actinomycetes bacterium]
MSPTNPQPDPGAGMAWPVLDGPARGHGDAFFVFDGAELRANRSRGLGSAGTTPPPGAPSSMYVEVLCNRQRLHFSLGCPSPADHSVWRGGPTP